MVPPSFFCPIPFSSGFSFRLLPFLATDLEKFYDRVSLNRTGVPPSSCLSEEAKRLEQIDLKPCHIFYLGIAHVLTHLPIGRGVRADSAPGILSLITLYQHKISK